MGILDNVIGSLLGGGNQNQSSGMGSVLSSILGGGQTGTNQAGTNQGGGLGGMLGGAAAGGGLGGLVSQFEQAGLGNVVQSWIGGGANHPVSPDQLQNVFGDKVPGMAQQAGMNQGDFLSQLSQHLPAAVDGMTSGGQSGDNSSVNV